MSNINERWNIYIYYFGFNWKGAFVFGGPLLYIILNLENSCTDYLEVLLTKFLIEFLINSLLLPIIKKVLLDPPVPAYRKFEFLIFLQNKCKTLKYIGL